MVQATASCQCLRVFNDTARYVDQGGGKRKGAFRDLFRAMARGCILFSLTLRKNHGKEEMRARDLIFCIVDLRPVYEKGGSGW